MRQLAPATHPRLPIWLYAAATRLSCAALTGWPCRDSTWPGWLADEAQGSELVAHGRQLPVHAL